MNIQLRKRPPHMSGSKANLKVSALSPIPGICFLPVALSLY
jgi:hypothetical protein